MKKFNLKNMVYGRLFEQDDDLFGDEDNSGDDGEVSGDEDAGGEEADLAGDAEGGEGGEEGGEEFGDDADFGGGGGGGGGMGGGGGGMGGGGGDEGGGEPAAETEPEVEVSAAEEYSMSDSIDQELDALMIDFEEEARKSSVVNSPVTESRMLYEAEGSDIDLRSFAANVARFVKNYQNLIDWESVILNKARSFVNNHYGEETSKALFDILEQEYDIETGSIGGTEKEEAPEAPIAVGGTAAGGL